MIRFLFSRFLFPLLCIAASLFFFSTSEAQAESFSSAREVYSAVFGPSKVTCADNGAGTAAACTLSPQGGTVLYTCSDANGCDVTLSENAQFSGRFMKVINVSANVVNFADTPGVTELAGAFAAGQWDVLQVVYASDRYVEVSRSNN